MNQLKYRPRSSSVKCEADIGYFFFTGYYNSLPNDKIVDQSNLKDFADDKINVTFYKIKFVMGRIENIVKKEENDGY